MNKDTWVNGEYYGDCIKDLKVIKQICQIFGFVELTKEKHELIVFYFISKIKPLPTSLTFKPLAAIALLTASDVQ